MSMDAKVGDRTVCLPTREDKMRRLAEINALIADSKHWGALLAALNEERQGILRSLTGHH